MTARAAGDDGLIEALRARPNKGKEPVEREMAQDGRMSLKAAGLLLFLLSKPDRWRTSAQDIAKVRERDGRDAVASGLRELEEFGYLARKRRNAGGGRFVWCWIYSDDPADVTEVLAVMFPEGVKPDARRGRARKTTPRVGGEKAQVEPMNGKPVDGSTDPQVDTMNGFSVDGSPVDGSPVDGKPVDIERQEKERTPLTPRPAGGTGDLPVEEQDPARCSAHNRTPCRPCGTSPRVQARAERERTAAELLVLEKAGKACPMCQSDGARRDGPGTRWIRVVPGTQSPISPYRVCDHVTPHAEVVAAIAEEELARERAQAARPAVEPRRPSAQARAAALAAARPRRDRENVGGPV